MTDYPDEIYDCPDGTYAGKTEWVRYGEHTHAGVMARRAYNLGRKHAIREVATETGWHDLTKAIADGEPIDWEQLDGVKARCVHAELGTLTYKLERDSNEPEDSPWGWFNADAPDVWGSTLVRAWKKWDGLEGGWTLYIDGEMPMKKKTADELPLVMCFSGKHRSHSDPTVWIVLDNEMGKVCIAPFVDGAIDASEVEVIEEHGIGTLSKMVSNND